MGKIPWIWRTGRPNPHQFDHEHDDNRPSRGYQHANRSPNPTNRPPESHDDPPNPPTTTAAGSEQGGGRGRRGGGAAYSVLAAARLGGDRHGWSSGARAGRGGGEGSAEAGLELGPDFLRGPRIRWILRFGRRAQRSNPSLASLAAGYWLLYSARAAHVRGREPLFGGVRSKASALVDT